MNWREKFLCYWWDDAWTDILTVVGPALVFILVTLFTSCSTLKEVPVEYIEKIEIRDSLVYIRDTVDVPVPYEVVKEVLPDVDTSYLETSVASSVAYLDTTKRQIHHELAQKGHLQAILDTIIVVEYVDKVIEKEVPVEVEIIKYRRDALFWVLVGWALLRLCAFLLRFAKIV